LLPIDGLAENIADTGITVRFITERLSRSGAGNIVLILDGCRDVGGKGLSVLGEETKKLVIENGLVSISACSPNEQSWEADELRQGIFTYAFLEALRDQNIATVRQIDNHLRRRIPELNALYRKPRQNPWLVAEPIRKADLILPPRHARERDLDKLKNLALEQEAEENLYQCKKTQMGFVRETHLLGVSSGNGNLRTLSRSKNHPTKIKTLERLNGRIGLG
jgi:uncharacterized caspase-like protein